MGTAADIEAQELIENARVITKGTFGCSGNDEWWQQPEQRLSVDH
jgi:hypothetical protein